MILSFFNFSYQKQIYSSPNIHIYKAILVGVLQGLYFLPIPDSWVFIPIFFFLLQLKAWVLLDLFSHSQNPQKQLLFSYLLQIALKRCDSVIFFS